VKALLSHEPGGPETLRLEELPDPVPGAGELLVRVRACAINYPDVLIIEDKYQLKPPRPFAPGSEIAGEVIEVGEGVSGWSRGDRLIAAVGTGDSGNKPENLAYGVPFAPVADRLDRLRACLTELRLRGITAWAGGNSAAVRRVASDSADAWNGWGRSADVFLDDASTVDARCDVTWGGQVLVGRDARHAAELLERHGTRDGLVHGTVDDLAVHLRALALGGTTWSVCAPIDIAADVTAVDRVVAARDAARRALA